MVDGPIIDIGAVHFVISRFVGPLQKAYFGSRA